MRANDCTMSDFIAAKLAMIDDLSMMLVCDVVGRGLRLPRHG